MNCEQARENFSAYVEGELDGNMLASLKQHFDECGDCAAGANDLAHVWSATGSLEVVEPPYGLHERIMSRFTELQEARQQEVPKITFWDILTGKALIAQRWARMTAIAILLALVAASPYVPAGRTVWAWILPGFQREIPVELHDSIAVRVSKPIEGAVSTLSLKITPDRDVDNAWVRARLTEGVNNSSQDAQTFNWRVCLRKGEYTAMSVPLEFTSAGMKTLRVVITGNDGTYRAEKLAFLPVRSRDQALKNFGNIPIYLDAQDMDIYDVLAHLSSTTKTPIIMDTDLHGTVNVSLEGDQLGSALEKVLTPLGYTWNAATGVYVVRNEPTQE